MLTTISAHPRPSFVFVFVRFVSILDLEWRNGGRFGHFWRTPYILRINGQWRRYNIIFTLDAKGDLSREIAKQIKAGIANFTGKSDYQFGDITKNAVSKFTGKDDYKFGGVTKKLMGNLFSGKKGKK